MIKVVPQNFDTNRGLYPLFCAYTLTPNNTLKRVTERSGGVTEGYKFEVYIITHL